MHTQFTTSPFGQDLFRLAQSLTPPTPPAPATHRAMDPEVLLDPAGALVALGDLALAIDRRNLRHTWDAWRRYCECSGRDEVLRTPPACGRGFGLLIEDREGWYYLLDLVLATTRRGSVQDTEGAWSAAGAAFTQAALNATTRFGAQLAHTLTQWQRLGWEDRDDEDRLVSEPDPELLAQLAAEAAHFGRLLLDEPRSRYTDAARRDARARAAVDRVIRAALREAELLVAQNTPAYVADDSLLVCELCQTPEGHDATCPLATLDGTTLLRVYRAALEGGM